MTRLGAELEVENTFQHDCFFVCVCVWQARHDSIHVVVHQAKVVYAPQHVPPACTGRDLSVHEPFHKQQTPLPWTDGHDKANAVMECAGQAITYHVAFHLSAESGSQSLDDIPLDRTDLLLIPASHVGSELLERSHLHSQRWGAAQVRWSVCGYNLTSRYHHAGAMGSDSVPLPSLPARFACPPPPQLIPSCAGKVMSHTHPSLSPSHSPPPPKPPPPF